MRIANLVRIALLSSAGALSSAGCAAPMNNYSKTPCFDNCGNDTQCQASCQQLGRPGTQPISTQPLAQPLR